MAIDSSLPRDRPVGTDRTDGLELATLGNAPPGQDLEPDPGLFGPDSVTWRVHADPVMVVAGVGGLLQALHPLAMAGVSQHSNFRADPWGRLARTGEYVATVTYSPGPGREAGGREGPRHPPSSGWGGAGKRNAIPGG